jgi:hypothetical protein
MPISDSIGIGEGLVRRGVVKQAAKRVVRQVRRRVLPKAPISDWESLLKKDRDSWEKYREASRDGPQVLIATSTGGHRAVVPLESLLAVALTLRGARVHILLCDEVLPACLQATSIEYRKQATFVRDGPKSLCRDCFRPGYATFQPLGLPVLRYSEWIKTEDRARASALSQLTPANEIAEFRLDGLKIGEHALAGALRYFAKGDLGDEPLGEAVLRRYFHASLLTAFGLESLFEALDFNTACFHHGIYVPQGIIGEVARNMGVRVVNWNPAYRKKCFIFSHNDTYHHTLLSEETDIWETVPWTTVLESKVMDYLKSRWEGTQDWIWFHERPEEDLRKIVRELGLDMSKPMIGLLTNVLWDAQLHYPSNAFPDMLDWLIQTIKHFSARPEIQLVIRVHPAEVRGWLPSRQPVVEEIRKVFQKLPENVYVIPPQSRISTYAVMLQCDSVIIYGTKTGVELTSLGLPVIVAGEAWIRNKGLTLDARTPEEYLELLDRLPLGKKLDDATTRRARKYAYHFFFRRMIPLASMQPVPGWPPYQVKISGIEDLLPGHDPGLDVICEGILHGTEFVLRDELQP